jgi:predicted dehydrogenase
MKKIGIIGYGYWGPNLVRNFMELPDCEVYAVSDASPERLNAFHARYPGIKHCSDYREILNNKEIDAVVVSTNLSTHYKISKDVLNAGKHMLLEKPVTTEVAEAEDLIAHAGKNNLIFMSGHTFLYNQAVRDTKNYLDKGEIGKVMYLHAERTNLGPIRNDTNALWDLAPHDISIFLYLLGQMPSGVSAHGGSYLKHGREDVIFLTLRFPDGIIGNIHVSWLAPCKVRKITVIGDKKMVLFDDLNSLEPIKLFDKGVEFPKDYGNYGDFRHILRDGDILIPKIKLTEPLKNECAAFINAVTKKEKPLSDGELGLQVVKVLSAAQRSLKNNGLFTEV